MAKHRGGSDVAPDGKPMADKVETAKDFDKKDEEYTRTATYPTVGNLTVHWSKDKNK